MDPSSSAKKFEEFEPRFDWVDHPDSRVLVVHLSGFRSNQLKVQVTSTGKLRVSGERKLSSGKWLRFQKEIDIPADADTDNISAKLEQGVLYVKQPKKPSATSSNIPPVQQPKPKAQSQPPPSATKPTADPPTVRPNTPKSQNERPEPPKPAATETTVAPPTVGPNAPESQNERAQIPYIKTNVKTHAMTKNVLVTTNADGEIQHWHMTSGKCLNTIKEPSADPQLYCINYNHDVTKFVAVGSEPTIKIYDEETKKLEYKLTGSGSSIPGHNSRVFCGKFDHEDPNIIVTGGWDERVLIWDLREKAPVRRIYGPRICGDGIDVFEGEVLTTSWTETDQLQIWDLGTEKLIHKVNWDDGPKTSLEPCKPYAGQFSKNDGSLILAGGSNAYEAKIFDREKLNRHVCTIYGMSREVNTVDFSNKGDKFAIGGSDGYIRIFSMNIIA